MHTRIKSKVCVHVSLCVCTSDGLSRGERLNRRERTRQLLAGGGGVVLFDGVPAAATAAAAVAPLFPATAGKSPVVSPTAATITRGEMCTWGKILYPISRIPSIVVITLVPPSPERGVATRTRAPVYLCVYVCVMTVGGWTIARDWQGRVWGTRGSGRPSGVPPPPHRNRDVCAVDTRIHPLHHSFPSYLLGHRTHTQSLQPTTDGYCCVCIILFHFYFYYFRSPAHGFRRTTAFRTQQALGVLATREANVRISFVPAAVVHVIRSGCCEDLTL